MSSGRHIDDLFEETIEEVKKGFSECEPWKKSLVAFHDAFDKKFPRSPPQERGTASALLWSLFTHVIAMSSMGFPSEGIIDSHAILESYSRRELTSRISSSRGKKVVEELVRRQSLDSLACSLRALGVLTDDDVKLSSELAQFRNGLAHRNVKPIKQLMKLSDDLHSLDVWYAASKMDWVPLQLGCIGYMVNLSGGKVLP
jgi:hypothetical protein